MNVRRSLVETATMLVLVLVAAVPLLSAYDAWDFWIAAGGGALLGAGLGWAGWRWRWHPLSVAALTVVAYFVFGGALVLRSASIAGVIPSLDVLAALALGVVQVWKQALTLQTPFLGFDNLQIVPYLATMVAAVAAVSVALRARRLYALALLAPAGLLVLAIAFSTFAAVLPGAVGAAALLIALAWLTGRRRSRRRNPAGQGEASRSGRIVPIGAIALLLACSLAAASAAGAMTIGDRQVLRDHIVPPLTLHDYASPLASYRKYERDGAEARLFTVTGLPAGTRVRLATLDAYDGVVYKVSGAGGAGSGVFSRVGREIETVPSGDEFEAQIEVSSLRGVWVPTVGYASAITFESTGAADREAALHYNAATGTAVVTTGLAEGDEYRLRGWLSLAPTDEQLAAATVEGIRTPAPAAVPDEIAVLLDKVTQGAETPGDQVRAIEAYFQTTGFYSSGFEGQVPSRSGHTLERESALLAGTQMIGDDEQYAVAMALMVSQLGLPVRVVMGFETAGEQATTVTGDDLHAWVEVPFQDLGWVAFDPTPAKDRVPQEETPQQAQKPQAQVAQPPQTPQEPAELPPPAPVEDESAADSPADLAWLWATLQIAGVSLLVLVVLLGPSLALAVVKARRRARRRAAASAWERVDGGWAELVDVASDVGAPVGAGATRREQARTLQERYPAVAAGELAVRADAAVFGGEEVAADEASTYWDDLDEAARALRAAVPWHRRLVARFFPASALARRGARRAPRSARS
ncbi:transglutaminase domain-containing protein [Microbacterium neimengense]